VATQRRTEPVAVSAATFSPMEQPHPTPEQRDERVSLAGPDPAEVLRALLKVDPDAESVVVESRVTEASSVPKQD